MDHLVVIARNPIPPGAVAGTIVSDDGTELRYARWPAASKERKGTVCLFQGRAEFIEKYFETVANLRRRGFAVATLDWRGQGGSARALRNPRKGHVEDFAQYDADLDAFMRQVVLPDCPPPYFALAHSMGGNIVLRGTTAKDCWFERVLLSAPMLHLARLPMPQSALAAVAEAAVLSGLGNLYAPGHRNDPPKEPAATSPLSSDPVRLERNEAILAAAPELGLGGPTFGWLRAACASMRHVTSDEFVFAVHVPVLMVAAGNDRIVSSLAIEQLAARLKAGAQIVLAGARHELLQERNELREQFWAAFDAFIPGSPLVTRARSKQEQKAEADASAAPAAS